MLRLKRKSALVPCLTILLFAGNALAQSNAPAASPQSTAAPAANASSPGSTLPSATTKSRQPHSAKRKTPTPDPPVVQAPPPPPPTPEQMAPVAPNVSYQSGQLTIQSNNATLAQVLRSVQAKTGASFDIPSSANSERVVAQLGPGQPKDILATLLNGSKFNYIILGSPNQPGSVQKVILTPRQNAPAINSAQNPIQQAQQQEAQAEEDYTPPEPTPSEDNSAPANQPPPGVFRPGSNGPTQPNQNGEFPPPTQQQDNNGQPQQGAKSPEQLLQELQRMQQQQQQYQQQLNPANQQPPQQ